MREDATYLIGGGSVSLITAAKLAKLNPEPIYLYEKNPQFGGVTRDMVDDHEREIFFSGCQYLEPRHVDGVLPESSNLDLVEHRYASITEQGKVWNFKVDFAGPTMRFGKEMDDRNLNLNQQYNTLEDVLASRPKTISKFLRVQLSRFKLPDYRTMPASALTDLQLERVASAESDEESLYLKQKYLLGDDVFGAPRLARGLPNHKAYVPREGFNSLWSEVEKDLAEKIHLIPNTLQNHKSFISVLPNSEPRPNSRFYFGDPRWFVRMYRPNHKLQSENYKIWSYGLNIRHIDGLPSLPFYVNVFSESSPITRLFFYLIHGKKKLTVETISKFESTHQITEAITFLLSKVGSGIYLSLDGSFAVDKESRKYFPMTISDSTKIREAHHALHKMGWSDTALEKYSRAERLDLILPRLSIQANTRNN